MRTLFIILFASIALQSTSPEEMYGAYDRDGKYQAMREQMDQVIQLQTEAEQQRNTQKALILGISIVIGLIPMVVVGRKIAKERSWENDPQGIRKALAIALAGGAALFALNYAVLYFKVTHNEVFMIVFPALLAIAAIAIFVIGMRKK